jgi:hypothetical protein
MEFFMLMKYVLIAFLSVFSGMAQIRRVDSHVLHERVVAVVPLVGKGTLADPIRPMFAPSGGVPTAEVLKAAAEAKAEAPAVGPAEAEKKRKTEILAYTWVPSDDKKFAIVEFVARDPEAFGELKRSALARVFDRKDIGRVENGRALLERDSVEAEIQRVRKDFRLTDLRTIVP